MACNQFRVVHLMFGAIIILTLFFYSLLSGNQHRLNKGNINDEPSIISNLQISHISSPLLSLQGAGNHSNVDIGIFSSKHEEINSSYSEVIVSSSVEMLQHQQQLSPHILEEQSNNIMKVERKKGTTSPDASQSNSQVLSSLLITNKNNVETNNTTIFKEVAKKNKKSIITYELYERGHKPDTFSVNNLCPNKGDALRLLILITSAPSHREQRLAIRQTWGHYGTRRDISIGFVLGRTTNQPLEDQLSAENYMYSDLVRGHFIDSYNNLTLKTISLLEWVDANCQNVTFVLKTDDDMFINVPKLLQFIEKHHKDKRTIYGRLAKKWKPIRNKKSKYYTSPEQYFPPIFPEFTTGPAYLLTSDIVRDLFAKSLNQTYLKLEDVYTTGIVAQLLNIKRININEFLNRRIAFNQCNIKKSISIHMIKSNEQFDLWKKLLDSNIKCK